MINYFYRIKRLNSISVFCPVVYRVICPSRAFNFSFGLAFVRVWDFQEPRRGGGFQAGVERQRNPCNQSHQSENPGGVTEHRPPLCRPLGASFVVRPSCRGFALSGFTACLGSVAPVGACSNCRLSRRSPARGISQSPGGAADLRQGWSNSGTPVTARIHELHKPRRGGETPGRGGAMSGTPVTDPTKARTPEGSRNVV